jgi:(S)-citramalyl-CoA lyase
MAHATRSWLFTPGTRPERFQKAREAGADVLIIDFEDAVAPDEKSKAREATLDYLKVPQTGTIGHAVRINGIDTPYGLADLQALIEQGSKPDFIVLPKTESADHLIILDRLLTRAGLDAQLVGLIESARGLSAVATIASATPRLSGLMLGAADMAADLGVGPGWEGLSYARGRLVAACAAAGVLPIDSPYFSVCDQQGLKDEIKRSVGLGFAAKAAIHPAQVEPINEALTPSEEEVAKARVILVENEKGVGVVDGQMIDEAVARKARRVLAAVGA